MQCFKVCCMSLPVFSFTTKDATHICLFLWEGTAWVLMNMNSSFSQNQEIGLRCEVFRHYTGNEPHLFSNLWMILCFKKFTVLLYRRTFSLFKKILQLFSEICHLNSILLNSLLLFKKWKDCVLAGYRQIWHLAFIHNKCVTLWFMISNFGYTTFVLYWN